MEENPPSFLKAVRTEVRRIAACWSPHSRAADFIDSLLSRRRSTAPVTPWLTSLGTHKVRSSPDASLEGGCRCCGSGDLTTDGAWPAADDDRVAIPSCFHHHTNQQTGMDTSLQSAPTICRELVHVDGHIVAADVHLPDGDDRPPVVFLHGILASLDLAAELFVDPAAEPWIALSLPGHHPGVLPADCAAADLDEDLFAHLYETTLKQLIGERQVLAAGWSTGGFAALNLAIRYPRRVAAVASLAGFASGRRIAGMMRWFVWLAGRPAGRPVIRLGLRLAAGWPGGYAFFLGCLAANRQAAAWIPADLVARMHRDFCHHDADSLVTALAALRSLDITPRLGEIKVPAWVAGGAEDAVVPRAETERIARAVPRATLRLYERAGHLFFCEWPRLREDFAAWRQGL